MPDAAGAKESEEVKSKGIFLLVVVSVFAIMFLRANADAGVIDPTWGLAGVTLVDFNDLDDQANALFLQPDGKLLVAGWVDIWPGDFGVMRLLPDGRQDPSFSGDGLATVAFSSNPDNVDAAWSVTMRPDGGAYVSGETCDEDYFVCQWATAAYDPDGALDEAFGGDGLVTTAAGSETAYAWPRRDILQADGKLIAGGVTYNSGENVKMGLRRLNPDGTLDQSFGDKGIVMRGLENKGTYVQDMLPLPGGKILVVGGLSEAIEDDPFFYDDDRGFMALFNNEGELDKAFGGGDGYAVWDYKGTPVVSKGGLYAAGSSKIYILGEVEDDCTLQRFHMDGAPDTSFGQDGWVRIDTEEEDVCWDLRETPDGKLAFDGASMPPEPAGTAADGARRSLSSRRPLARSAANEPPVRSMLIGRYLADGTADDTFGVNGLLHYALNEEGNGAFGLAVQPDGKLISITDIFNLDSGNIDFGVLRFLSQEDQERIFLPAVMAP